jgi:3-oxoacyl-[acyl-carrier-protein] synthase-3
MELSTEYATRLRAPDPIPRAGNGRSPTTLRPAGIIGLGSYVPERVLANAELEQLVETTDEWIRTRTGISERRLAAPEEATRDLANRAAERALADAGVPGSAVDMVVVATVTPDFPFPAVASTVQDHIGARSAGAFDLAAGCSGFIYSLAVGAQFVQTGMCENVLVVGAEILSRLVDWTDRSTCVLFGDGAGAVLLGPSSPGRGILAVDLGSDGAGAQLLYVEAGGSRYPATAETVAERRHAIRMNGREVFKFAVRAIEESTQRALDRAGLTVADIDCFVAHQANARIFDAAAERLRIDPDRVYNNVNRYGNTSSASIPLALDEARAEGKVRPGDIVALVGFGAGLSWASAIVRWE